MTKIKITAIIFATLISVTTQSLFAQSGTSQPTPISPEPILEELGSQFSGSNIEGIVSEPELPQPIESSGAVANGQEVFPELSDPPQASNNQVLDEEFFQSENSDNVGTLAPGLLGSFFRSPSGTNRVWSISGVSLSREEFNDGVQLSGNVSSGQVVQDLGGLDLGVVTRNSGGRGWEFRYTGLFEDTTSIGGVPSLTSLGATQSLDRTSELHNLELNLIRQRRSQVLYTIFDLHESTIGVRYLRFDETLDFREEGGFTIPRQQVADVENALFGIQSGRRIEKRLFGKVGIFASGELGIFSNRAQSNNFVSPTAFGTSTTRETKTDIAFLGELDLGGIYTFNQNIRAKLGYRILGVTGVALADGQFNQDLTPQDDVNTAGDLYLRGGYFGFEFVY